MRNDYRDYLMHYGVKGMKWRHRRGLDPEERRWREIDHYDDHYSATRTNDPRALKRIRAKHKIRHIIYGADRSNTGVKRMAKQYNSRSNERFQNKYFDKSEKAYKSGNVNKGRAIDAARFSVYDAGHVANVISTGKNVKSKKKRKSAYRKMRDFRDSH